MQSNAGAIRLYEQLGFHLSVIIKVAEIMGCTCAPTSQNH